ncbi:helix-turn-helix transcriptional regulator [Hydrogenimonas sp.]
MTKKRRKDSIEKKVNNLYTLMEKLAGGEEIYPQNERLQAELEVDERTLRRYLKDLHQKYAHILVAEKKRTERGGRRVTVHRVVDRKRDVAEAFRFFLESGEDLGWLLQLVYENDPSLFRDFSRDAEKSLKKVLEKDREIFRFVDSPFENLDDDRFKRLFSTLRNAVKNREYRTVLYRYDTPETLTDVKCLKLLHMNRNWYLAVETTEGKLRILRLAFIQEIRYSKKSNYRGKALEKYASFFQNIQNAMTLDAPFRTARLLASPRVARYFRKGMKPFFPSQKFVEEREDGSVEFTIDYTQPMEILPFVKQWQPDIRILEPEELREALRKDLEAALANFR